MIFQVYSVRDCLSGFQTPVIEQNDALALRNFRMACDAMGRQPTIMTWRPTDFSFYRIATFNSDDGSLIPEQPIVLIATGQAPSEEV